MTQTIRNTHRFAIIGLMLGFAGAIQADSVPEVLHYRFDTDSVTQVNSASSPPAGTATATVMGALTTNGTDLNFAADGYALVGSGNASTTDYLNTNYAPNLAGSSWTISVATSNIAPSATLFYIFGDANSNSFRCFTNGVAGPNNWILRGAGLTDVTVPNGAVVGTHRTTFVYDLGANEVRGYLDGVLVTTVAQTAPALIGTGPLKVMGYATNVGAPAGGLIDDFRLYNRALSAQEVAEIDAYPLPEFDGNGIVIADGDDTPDTADNTDFGGTLVDGGTVTRNYTVTNAGNLLLTPGAITFTGDAAADFTVTSSALVPMAPGESGTVTVVFDPSAAGARAATLEFQFSGATAPVTFDVLGQGQTDDMFEDGFEEP